MPQKLIAKTVTLNGQTVTLEIGRYAEQATAAVLAKCQDMWFW